MLVAFFAALVCCLSTSRPNGPYDSVRKYRYQNYGVARPDEGAEFGPCLYTAMRD